jgi:hypothetical protein
VRAKNDGEFAWDSGCLAKPIVQSPQFASTPRPRLGTRDLIGAPSRSARRHGRDARGADVA